MEIQNLENLKAEGQALFKMATQCEAHVLILGPTGTGKSTLAKKIHDSSARSHGPFVTVNLATVHEGTLESELFGHEKGAFTGADLKRIGRLEGAQGGTVFLDEIGELSPRLQARLLDFLQSQVITPVGSNREIKLNVRVIAATHKNLEKAVEDGKFREDLFHRLRVLAFELKPLVERTGELDLWVHKFLAEFSKKHQKTILKISPAVAKKLEAYFWPGNLRELSNVVEFMVLSCVGSEVQEGDLPRWFIQGLKHAQVLLNHGKGGALGVAEVSLSLSYQESLERFEREYLKRALSRFRGRINMTARQIGINKATLIRRVRAYSLLETETAN